jgi:1-aminocyclopropane-1-carboxylate deaminase/D-cysteine desulfhydrase-like pyridoxal-dependent ACC family enzyme
VLVDMLPRLQRSNLPTALEPLPAQVAGADAWIKRDDRTAAPYGGNKVRKLELILADARRRGARRLVTAGAFGSHHCLATALYGRRAGFDVTCYLFPQPLTPHVRDVLVAIANEGAELVLLPRMEAVPLALMSSRARLLSRPCIVAPGGSDALGTLAYANAGLELVEQIERGEAPRFREIHVAAGTLGTAAGIALGLALGGERETRVVAVRITSRLVTNERVLNRLVRTACSRLRRAGVEAPDAAAVCEMIHIEHGQVGEGYGRETAMGRAAEQAFAAAGVRLDATYTAKAAASFQARPSQAAPALFWHTLSAAHPPVADDAIDRLPAVIRRRIEP